MGDWKNSKITRREKKEGEGRVWGGGRRGWGGGGGGGFSPPSPSPLVYSIDNVGEINLDISVRMHSLNFCNQSQTYSVA